MEERLRDLAAHVRRQRGPNAQKIGSQRDLATRAKISHRKVSDVERGIRAGAKTYDALERALRFPPGSIERYLTGGGPLPQPDAGISAGTGLPAASPYEWSAEARQKMIAMDAQQALAFIEHERLLHGDAHAFAVMQEITRIREEAAAIPVDAEADAT